MTVWEITVDLLKGFGVTLELFLLTLLLSLPLGLVFAGGARLKFTPIRWLVRGFVYIIRGTPLMLQLLAVTYGPYYLFGVGVARNKLIPVIIAFAINYAAYFAKYTEAE